MKSFWIIALCLSAGISADAAVQRPNVVIIYTDDQGVGDVSALNPESRFATPNLDRLVREGMTFTDGHSSDTVCTPSRYGLLTGRYSWRTRLKKGVMGADEPQGLIEKGRITLASLLRANGYRTGMFGKWHLGMQFDGTQGDRDWTKPFRDGPIDHGFETFFGIPASMNYGVLSWLEGDRVTQPASLWTAKKPGLVTHDKASYRITPPYSDTPIKSRLGSALEVAADFDDIQALTRFTDRATQFIKANASEPFFAYVPLTSPHKPVIPAPEFVGTSKCGAYGDFMVETDFRVGQILETLDSLGLAENTLVIFTSDNGAENTYAQRLKIYGHASSGKLRGGKRDIYEGGHRVPFLVRWPAKIAANSQCNTPVCQTDILATLAEILEITLPADAGEDSESLYRLMQGQQSERGPLVHHSANGGFAVRENEWKLLVTSQPMRLYNLQSDLAETKDVAQQHPELVADLAKKFEAIIQRGRSTSGLVQANFGGPDYRVW